MEFLWRSVCGIVRGASRRSERAGVAVWRFSRGDPAPSRLSEAPSEENSFIVQPVPVE